MSLFKNVQEGLGCDKELEELLKGKEVLDPSEILKDMGIKSEEVKPEEVQKVTEPIENKDNNESEVDSEDFLNLDDEDKTKKSEDEKITEPTWETGITKKKKIVLIVLFSIILLVIILKIGQKIKSKFKEDNINDQIPIITSVENKIDAPLRDYPEYVEIPSKYYTDKVVISKFAEFNGNTYNYYFTGIPMDYKKTITFPVSLGTYNKVANGSVVNIDYILLDINGIEYVSSVTTNLGGLINEE